MHNSTPGSLRFRHHCYHEVTADDRPIGRLIQEARQTRRPDPDLCERMTAAGAEQAAAIGYPKSKSAHHAVERALARRHAPAAGIADSIAFRPVIEHEVLCDDIVAGVIRQTPELTWILDDSLQAWLIARCQTPPELPTPFTKAKDAQAWIRSVLAGGHPSPAAG